MKKSDSINEENQENIQDSLEKKMPFAVPPSDRRFFMSAPAVRGDSYPDQEPHSMGSSHYEQPQRQLVPNHAIPQYHHQYPYQYHPNYQMRPYMSLAPSPIQAYGTAWHNPPHVHEINGNHPSDGDPVSYMKHSEHYAQPSSYLVQPVGNNINVLSDFYFVALVTGCTVAAVFGVIGLGMCYFRLNKSKRDASDAEYPAYGVTGPNKEISPGAADRKLAQSAHMYHYQHQKQQMIAIEKSSTDDRHCSTSDVDSEEEGDEGHYTVYECPGLAPTGEMEVKNPLFTDDPTPASPVPATSEAQTQ